MEKEYSVGDMVRVKLVLGECIMNYRGKAGDGKVCVYSQTVGQLIILEEFILGLAEEK